MLASVVKLGLWAYFHTIWLHGSLWLILYEDQMLPCASGERFISAQHSTAQHWKAGQFQPHCILTKLHIIMVFKSRKWILNSELSDSMVRLSRMDTSTRINQVSIKCQKLFQGRAFPNGIRLTPCPEWLLSLFCCSYRLASYQSNHWNWMFVYIAINIQSHS